MPTLEAAKTQVGPLPEQVSVNLDRGYDSDKTRCALAELGFTGETARKTPSSKALGEERLPTAAAGRRACVNGAHAPVARALSPCAPAGVDGPQPRTG